jgi:SpoVK/Ycf46/Vps4 family AAA+-type ATPase
LALALKDIPLDGDVDLDQISGMLNNYSGADVTSLCRDAALMSMRRVIRNKSPSEIRQLNKVTEYRPEASFLKQSRREFAPTWRLGTN